VEWAVVRRAEAELGDVLVRLGCVISMPHRDNWVLPPLLPSLTLWRSGSSTLRSTCYHMWGPSERRSRYHPMRRTREKGEIPLWGGVPGRVSGFCANNPGVRASESRDSGPEELADLVADSKARASSVRNS
jgi:hypothetical protein